MSFPSMPIFISNICCPGSIYRLWILCYACELHMGLLHGHSDTACGPHTQLPVVHGMHMHGSINRSLMWYRCEWYDIQLGCWLWGECLDWGLSALWWWSKFHSGRACDLLCSSGACVGGGVEQPVRWSSTDDVLLHICLVWNLLASLPLESVWSGTSFL